MKRIPQRTIDDYTICSVATFLGLPYDYVLIVASKSLKYVPGSGTYCNPAKLIEALGYKCKFKTRDIVTLPCLVSLNLENLEEQRLVVLTQDGVIDPSNKTPVTVEHCYQTVSFSYWV